MTEEDTPKFPRKRLLVRGDTSNMEHDEKFDAVFEELKRRLRQCKATLQAGNLDAPVFKECAYLGKINETNPAIFKVNVPGYIYRFSPTVSFTTVASGYGKAYANGKTGIMLSYDPKYLVDNSDESKRNRMLYMTAWDGKTCSNANAMFSINPGGSTYMYIGRDTSIADTAEAFKEFYFVPTTLATCMNVHPDDYIVKVGSTSVAIELKDYLATYINNDVVKKVFDSLPFALDSRGHLRNFAAVRGWMRTRRTLTKFTNSTFREEFYKTHPESQTKNDDYEDFWRYGLVATRLPAGTARDTALRHNFANEPWINETDKESLTSIQQTCFTTANKYQVYTTDANITSDDNLNWGKLSSYCIAFYALMEVKAGHTYSFSLRYDNFVGVSIDGSVFITGSTTAGKGSYTAEQDGLVPFILVCGDTNGNKSGGTCTMSVTHLDEAGKTIYDHKNVIIGNDVDRLLFRVPSEVTRAQYMKWNKFLANKQTLVTT